MNKKTNWNEYRKVLVYNGITKLYHFTDFENLKSIIDNEGLYSWAGCEDKGISIKRPGGGELSRRLDRSKGLENYVKLSFVPCPPSMYVAMNEGRISNPVVLEIDLESALWEDTKYANMSIAKDGAQVGEGLDDLDAIHFNLFGREYLYMSDAEKMYYEAEVLVKNFIPLRCITNIGNFGYNIPAMSNKMLSKEPYTAQITRNTPTAFIFLIDQSVSMSRVTNLGGEMIPMSEAVSRIVNEQLEELVLRCLKTNEVRHYYDIAVIGYGDDAHSGWNGALAGRDFVSPEELMNHPYRRIKVKVQTNTRRGTVMREVEKVQWMEARSDGHWTRVHEAFVRAKKLLDGWMETHHDKDCYPPTVINITDGVFNGATKDDVLQKANYLKSMFTNDGNVILFNIHITPSGGKKVVFPTGLGEVSGNGYSTMLYNLSSLLPMRYNGAISDIRNDGGRNVRHVAMAVNSDMSTLIQLMDIGTPTNISQNQ